MIINKITVFNKNYDLTALVNNCVERQMGLGFAFMLHNNFCFTYTQYRLEEILTLVAVMIKVQVKHSMRNKGSLYKYLMEEVVRTRQLLVKSFVNCENVLFPETVLPRGDIKAES